MVVERRGDEVFRKVRFSSLYIDVADVMVSKYCTSKNRGTETAVD